ncbi:polyphosphate polymerase domain-containing protein [Leucobacter sp.]
MQTAPPIPLERFAPVSLDEIVSEAALLTRVDRKYLVPRDAADAILSRTDPDVRVLEIAGRREFAYDSVYFDTADHLSYRLTAQRRRRRFKLRTRSYLDTGAAYLELKTKSGRGSTVKDRMDYDPADRARLTAEGRAYLRGLLEGHGHDPALVDQLHPSLVSRYRRATLLLPDGSRATVDTQLRWSDGGVDGGRAIALPGHVIIESKSPGPPSRLDRALWRAGHRPSGISKFGTGTAALHPELPSNKWARTLRDPFALSAHTPKESS